MSNAKVLQGLNPQQEKAVIHSGSPLLIIAGAGSGKTRVLTRRIAYLLQERQIAPWQILAITFTNKAAGEMKQRVEELVGARAKAIWVSTFHSAAVRILRKEAVYLGYSNSFTIYDASDSLRLLTKITKDLNIDSKRFGPKIIQGIISSNKNELIGPAEYQNRTSNPFEKVIADVYHEYERRLKLANALDFDDLIGKTVEILQRFPEIRAKYRSRFTHILVDEYQDTNHAQYVLVHELVGRLDEMMPVAELCVVGDADQSIYGFRGANIRNILQFESDYPNAQTILLEQNYRSTENILKAANSVIANNKGRKEKELWSALGTGDLIAGYIAASDKDEATYVVDQIESLCEDDKYTYGNIALFYRTNAQSRSFEEIFTARGIPYKVVGGVRFYERREVKDFLAYLRIIVNPEDEVSLRRVINVPKRGIGDRALDLVDEYAKDNGLSFWSALQEAEKISGLQNRSFIAIKGFTSLIIEFQNLNSSGEFPSDIASEVLDKSGLRDEYEESDDLQDEGRIENLEGLISVAVEYEEGEPEVDEETGDVSTPTLLGFLEKVSLVADSDEIPEGEEHGGVVTLMTLHTAKGLEFQIVFLTGMEDGIFPHMRTLGNEDEIEEERRLAYVGLTRAMEKLFVTRSYYRLLNGAPNYNPISRFIAEIPEHLIEWSGEDGPSFSDNLEFGGQIFGKSNFRLNDNNLNKNKNSNVRSIRGGSRPAPTGKVLADLPLLEAGDRVSHDTFGLGKVISVEGVGDRATATIDFGSLGEKRLLLRFAPVTKI